jgi:hypothetical protein
MTKKRLLKKLVLEIQEEAETLERLNDCFDYLRRMINTQQPYSTFLNHAPEAFAYYDILKMCARDSMILLITFEELASEFIDLARVTHSLPREFENFEDFRVRNFKTDRKTPDFLSTHRRG